MLRAILCACGFASAGAFGSPSPARRGEQVRAAQFGGRQGCCVKADSYLASLTSVAASARPAAPSVDNLWHRDWVWLLDDSLRRLHGSALLPSPRASASHCASLAANDELVCVSHEASSGEPIFNYATQAALDVFEMSWDEFVSTPSKHSADPLEQAERDELLRRVDERGFVDDFAFVRISKTGRRFRISSAVIWNVDDGAGRLLGQAALFRRSDIAYL
mmetsp:Transcript_6068/g.18293  ORF Transcript_6068/g.18293 Transcript_6068/m.18293 type:complete len:219 (-) Transcript_6068:290-946(-)